MGRYKSWLQEDLEYVRVSSTMKINNNDLRKNDFADFKGSARTKFNKFLRYFRLVILAVLLALIIKSVLVEAYNIPSESMENTLLVGDFLLADKFTFGPEIPFTDIRMPALRDPQVGDVIVFRFPDNPTKNFIKRVVAKGGDEVHLLDKILYVNGNPINESRFAIHSDSIIIPTGTSQPRDNFGPITIPVGHYFVLGDNRDNSSDSRYWGTVPRDMIYGKALLVHWSWKPDSDAPQVTWWNPISILGGLAYNVYHLPERVRWSRLFHSIN